MQDRHSNLRAFWKYQEGDVYHLTFDNDCLGSKEGGAPIRTKGWTMKSDNGFLVSCELAA